ncbi:MAG TPA: L,D-transpeptidase [Thermomicrobiaceae bacterium]|nr:L,D-transpeptidase [Thermomicrobiaceae bacterium]
MRRALVVLPVLVLLVASLLPSTASAAVAPPAPAAYDTGPSEVYFPETGHHLSLGFLNYWRYNGDVTVFGYPISEEFQQNGVTVQYFQRAVFEYHPNAPAPDQIQVRRLGADLAPAAESAYLGYEIQQNYLASRLGMDLPYSDPFAAIPPTTQDATQTYFTQTGHSLSGEFNKYWLMWGGVSVFGYPLSEPFTDPSTGLTVQYFERAVFEFHPDNPAGQQVTLELLGSAAAQQAGVTTTSVAQGANIPVYAASLWHRNLSINPADVTVPPPGAPFGETKWIEVDLAQQYLRAWEGRTLVYSTYVSTGTPQDPTPTGYFSVYEKVPSTDMNSATIGIPKGAPGYYNLPNVPNVMYFLSGGYAIHGAYWHWNFGTEVSHGCVNEPLPAAAWMYNWTPLGTVVWVHN